MTAARDVWCIRYRLWGEPCAERWAEREEGFRAAWSEQRDGYLRNLPKPDHSGRDLRGADLRNAFLVGANLRQARLEGANLGGRGWKGRTSRGPIYAT